MTVFLSACSTQTAGGGPTGSEAGNALTATFINGDGSPASNARVYLRPSNYDGTESLADTVLSLDSNGHITANLPDSGAWVLEVRDSLEGVLVPLTIDNKDTSDKNLPTISLSRYASISGSVPLPLQEGAIVVVVGTGSIATPDSTGNFILSQVSPGTVTVRALVPSTAQVLGESYVSLAPSQPQKAGILRSSQDNILWLDDFEDGDTQNRFGPIQGGGWWYATAASGVEISPNPSLITVEHYSIDQGMVLHVRFAMDSLYAGIWAETGTRFGDYTTHANLSTLDSLVFYAKGTGTPHLHLPIASNTSDSIAPIPSMPLTLSNSWTRISITPSDLLANDTTGTLYSVEAVRNLLARTTLISWSFKESSELWLDNIQIFGVAQSQLYLAN